MFPRLIHIYGPVWVQSYGTMIAIGLMVFLWLSIRNKRRAALISRETYINAVFVSLAAGVMGGRLLYVASYPHEFIGQWQEIFYPWIGGLTVIGSIIGVIIGGGLYLRYHKIAPLPLYDLAALYAPLMQAISRFGCFAAGCCYGAPAPIDAWYAITFTSTYSHGPCNIPLHPAQLYTALASLIAFIFMYTQQDKLFKYRGMPFFTFLILENSARFITDFWRGDREPIIATYTLNHQMITISQVQLYAIIGLALALAGLLWSITRRRAR